jgi:Domain of unknown function (DUF1772)
MKDSFATAMLLSGALFAGGVLSIAWERVPAWRAAELGDFRATFAHTLRRVDRLQPVLLVLCLGSTIGFAVAAGGSSRTLSLVAAAGLLGVLAGSVAVLVPIQRKLAKDPQLSSSEAERLRNRWLRGHVLRTVAALAVLVLVVIAAVAQ